jgi:hypothetical protein
MPIGHPQLIAVGWLAQGEPYSRGPISKAFVDALLSLLGHPYLWQPFYALGWHCCEFCRISGGPDTLRLRKPDDLGKHADLSISLGTLNLFVPHEGKIFVSPSLIAHYIDAHEYAPPEIYQTAVLRCPPMHSIEYLKAILNDGPPEWWRLVKIP